MDKASLGGMSFEAGLRLTKATKKAVNERVAQGDIYRNVAFLEKYSEHAGDMELTRVVFPLAVVLTQDCDLEWDAKFKASERKSKDKVLLSVLLAPLYNLQHLLEGSHLEELSLQMRAFNLNSSGDKKILTNQIDRYHCLRFDDEIPIVPGVIDFKHYFSVPVDLLQKSRNADYVCSIDCLFREDVSQRFASYLSRVALPELAQVDDPAGTPNPGTMK